MASPTDTPKYPHGLKAYEFDAKLYADTMAKAKVIAAKEIHALILAHEEHMFAVRDEMSEQEIHLAHSGVVGAYTNVVDKLNADPDLSRVERHKLIGDIEAMAMKRASATVSAQQEAAEEGHAKSHVPAGARRTSRTIVENEAPEPPTRTKQ